MYVYIDASIYIYIYIYIQRERERDASCGAVLSGKKNLRGKKTTLTYTAQDVKGFTAVSPRGGVPI